MTPFPGQYVNAPPQPYNNQGMNPVQGSAAPPPPGYQPRQPGYNYQMANEPEFVRGHNDMPHPGEVYAPPKKHLSERMQILILGIIIGGGIMWKIFPYFDRAIKAIFGG